MIRRRAVVVIVAVAIAHAAAVPTSNEPFTTFRVMDKQLSVINEQSAQIKPGITRKERNRTIRKVRAAIGNIRQGCRRMTSLYRARHERFGVKMFRTLDQKALAVAKSLGAVERARSDADRGRALVPFQKATLKLVLQFQAVSANYGANHCTARQWACCEPRRDPETNRSLAEGCKWNCTARRQACSGFVGPQTAGQIPARP